MNESPTIHVVDDDLSVREALRALLESVGMKVAEYESAESFLRCDYRGQPGCLVLDVRMPGMGGLDLLVELRGRGWEIPVVYITGHGDVPMSVRAMKLGAVDFLLKPFNEQELLDAVQKALAADDKLRDARRSREEVNARLDTLTPREREVLELVVEGYSNREVGTILGAAENTIKIHRSRVLKKMQATSLPELVRMAEVVGILDTP
jgi:two-component system response regulator FixJ